MSFDKLRSQMLQFGIEPPADFTVYERDAKIHRFGKKKNSWYALYWFQLDSGERVLTGRFGDWKIGVDEKVDLDMPELSPEERKRFAQEQREAAKAAAQAKADKQREAAQRATQIWEQLPDQGKSPYLDKKRVKAFGLRFSRGSIVVPLRTVTDELVGLQFIASDGSKTFLTGTAKKAAFHLLGNLNPSGRLMVAEGYATAASLYQALKQKVPAVVAFDAGNLEPVVKSLRKQYPNLHMVICADNDTKTAGNPGVTKAMAAAKAVDAKVVIPQLNAAREAVANSGEVAA